MRPTAAFWASCRWASSTGCSAGTHRITAEAGVVVNHDLDLVTAHRIAHEAQHGLLHGLSKLAGATIHVSPQAGPGVDPRQIIDHHDTLQ